MTHRIAIILVVALSAATSGTAQTVERTREGLRLGGRVVDAATSTGLAGVTVVVEPEVLGAFPGASAGSGFAAAARTTRTDSAGRYLFTGLAPGPYRLYATRYGYRPFSVTVELGRSSAGLSVALDADPITLEPVRSRGQARGPYVATDPFGPARELERARLVVADLRRSRFLSTDVRELTHADVVESVTLGEPDLFRALQRLPGVTTRSDYTAALWTRGAPWSQTRVYYDGIPLFNPLHALGMISGIGSSSIGSVWFHPGVRSAGIAEGAAGVVDLRSRPAGGLGEMNVLADASLATAGVAIDQRVLGGSAGWMLSGRTSYLDWLADLARRAAGQEDATFPYHFSEVAGRVDAHLSPRQTLEASWLWEGDRLQSGPTAAGDPLEATWGNALARITWSTVFGDQRVQHTVGWSRHDGLVRIDPDYAPLESVDAARRSETGIDYLSLRGAIWPDDGAVSGPRWSGGYELGRYMVRYEGPIPLPVPRAVALATPNFEGNLGPVDSVDVGQWTEWDAALPVLGLWFERRLELGPVAARLGVRAETGPEIRDTDPVRLAPRFTIRLAPIPELSLSAGLARIYQYVQTVAPGGVHLASLVSTDAWILAGPGVPAIRSDVATAGLEARVAPGRVMALNTFARTADGMVVPNPEPGPVLDRSPSMLLGRNTAVGIEASVRQLSGPLTGSIAYSLTRSRMQVADYAFPSAADRTHVLSATGMVRPLPGLRMGAAFTAATGVPFTRAISDSTECLGEPTCVPAELPWAGDPNAIRGPTYASLDLLVDWTTEVAGLDVGIYGQLRNVLGRENATVYAGGSGCLVVGCSVDELRNAYEEGVPRLPVLGIRVQY
jgi:hypothetical protein